MNDRITLDYRYYLTEDGKRLVREGDAAAHSLLYRAGDSITKAEADKWGLHKPAATPPAPIAHETKVLTPESKEAPKPKAGK